ncbi:MAG TPA: response regulator [Longimicrobiales bacterium]|nr:response regulator [Longimicrobiales bacterium]
MRVLIVDDEAELVGALTERLALRGFEAEGVTDGPSALARLAGRSGGAAEPAGGAEAVAGPPSPGTSAGRPDVVLVDVKMPGMDGLALVREIRASYPDVRIVLITGHGSVREAEEGMGLGVFEYLVKPVPIDELVRVLRAAREGAS